MIPESGSPENRTGDRGATSVPNVIFGEFDHDFSFSERGTKVRVCSVYKTGEGKKKRNIACVKIQLDFNAKAIIIEWFRTLSQQ